MVHNRLLSKLLVSSGVRFRLQMARWPTANGLFNPIHQKAGPSLTLPKLRAVPLTVPFYLVKRLMLGHQTLRLWLFITGLTMNGWISGIPRLNHDHRWFTGQLNQRSGRSFMALAYELQDWVHYLIYEKQTKIFCFLLKYRLLNDARCNMIMAKIKHGCISSRSLRETVVGESCWSKLRCR